MEFYHVRDDRFEKEKKGSEAYTVSDFYVSLLFFHLFSTKGEDEGGVWLDMTVG